jgi:hypothetical protein
MGGRFGREAEGVIYRELDRGNWIGGPAGAGDDDWNAAPADTTGVDWGFVSGDLDRGVWIGEFGCGDW